MPIYDSFEAGILTEGMTSEQKMQFHREMTEAWKDPDKAKRLRRWLGGIGAHHFYLGNQSRGLKYLLFCLTGVPAFMTMFEGDIKRRTAQVNSEIAHGIAARIRGGVPMHIPQPGTGFTQPGASPEYTQGTSNPTPASAPHLDQQYAYSSAESRTQTAVKAPSSAKRWALIVGGGIVALWIVSATVAAFTSKAKESTTSERPAVASDNASTPIPVGSAPDVQVYIAPDAESVVKAAGMTEQTIKDAVREGLAQRRIVSIADNAVMEDWVSVRFFLDPKEGGSQLGIEFSVRNGASANNQLIRWQQTNTIEALGNPTDMPTTLTRLMDNLKGDFNSPEYKKGRGPEASASSKQATPELAAQSHESNVYDSCLAAAPPGAAWNCIAAEFEREDARLNQEYKRVMSGYKARSREDDIAALRKIQVAWLKSMTTECDSMTMQQAIYGCRLDWTKKRADEIAKLP